MRGCLQRPSPRGNDDGQTIRLPDSLLEHGVARDFFGLCHPTYCQRRIPGSVSVWRWYSHKRGNTGVPLFRLYQGSPARHEVHDRSWCLPRHPAMPLPLQYPYYQAFCRQQDRRTDRVFRWIQKGQGSCAFGGCCRDPCLRLRHQFPWCVVYLNCAFSTC